MPDYTCARCNKVFTKKCNYETHISKKNLCRIAPQETAISRSNTAQISIKDDMSDESAPPKCNYCGAVFTRKDSLSRHIKKSCKIKKENDNNMEALMEEMIKMKEDMQSMKNKMHKLEKENSKYKEIVRINNITQNNNFNFGITPYGMENITNITPNEYSRIFRRGMNSVPALVEKIHFDENKPENHNIYMSNIRGKYVLVFDGKRWRLKNRDMIIGEMYDEKSDILETKFEELFDKLDESTKNMFNKFLKVKDIDGAATKRIKEDIQIILYENRKMAKNMENKLMDKTDDVAEHDEIIG